MEENRIDNEEMEEIDVTEVHLDSEEIDELIGKLQELKQSKTEISFDLDETNELLVKYHEHEGEE